MNVRFGIRLLLITPLLVAALSCGAVKERQVVTAPPAYAAAKTASLSDLVDLVNDRYAGVDSLTVSKLDVEFTGGSIEDGYFEKYRTAKGYLVAEEPKSVFVNILNPLTSSSVLVMASHNDEFQIWIPSRNQFVTGRTDVKTDEDNPVYNVRPLHILEGILIESVPVQNPEFKYYIEEDKDEAYKYYVLGIFRSTPDSPVLELQRKIWIERSTMHIRRQQYYSGSELTGVINYGSSVEIGNKLVTTRVEINRPVERYAISFEFKPETVELNRELKPESFTLRVPAGAEVVQAEGND